MQNRISAFDTMNKIKEKTNNYKTWPIGKELGVSPWLVVDQVRINAFGAITDDLEPIHNNIEWCSENSPYKTPISYGFLTLSLLTKFINEVTDNALKGDENSLSYPLNYGFNKIRFLAPVKSGSRIRCRFTLRELKAKKEGDLMLFDASIEIDGEEKPALIAQWLSLWVNRTRENY